MSKKYSLIFGIALAYVTLFTACDDVFEPQEIHTPIESNYGRISIGFTGEEAARHIVRTVLPQAVFDEYVYTFTKAGETTGVERSPDNEGFFTLEVGSYTVKVQAYIGNADPYTLAASGVSPEFIVEPGNNDPVVVFLSWVNTGEEGEFSYTITYPAGATATITLQKWPELDDITLNPVNLSEGNGITQTFQLEAGSYLLAVLINKNELYAGISEAVHIYPSLETVYTKNFVDGDLHTRFTVTFNANGATSGTAPAAQTVAAGSSITLPSGSGLTRSGYTFDGWNTNASGTGTNYNAGATYTPSGNISLYARWTSSLTITTSDLNYTNPNGLTPIDSTATFTVTVRGFVNASDANNVELNINSVTGLSFSGHNTTGNAIGGAKNFTVTVSLLDTTAFPSITNSATITIAGLTAVPSGYTYSGGNVTKSINIIDGRSSLRAIPVYQNNISRFNSYAGGISSVQRHYKLTGHIILSAQGTQSNWTSMGSSSNLFTGSFDGQGYTISNLTRNLFSYIDGGTVKNIGLLNINISVSGNVAGIVSFLENGTIENCYVEGSISSSSTSGASVGGIAGYMGNGTIKNCYVEGSVSGHSRIGGIVGNKGGGTVENCYVTADISGLYRNGSNYDGGGYTGGIVGGNRGIVRNCVALSGRVNFGSDGAAYNTIGRVAGDNTGTLNNNYARSNMAGSTIYTTVPFSYKTHDGKGGADVSSTSPNGGFNNQDFWQNTMQWSFDSTGVWEWDTLKNLPKLKVIGQGDYIVIFDADNASGTPPAPMIVAVGSSITLPSGSGLTKSGYTFCGWNTTNTSWRPVNYSTGDSYLPTDNITLYAFWCIPLNSGIWIGHTATNVPYTFTFNVTSGVTYHVWWNHRVWSNPSASGDSSKTATITVSAYYLNGPSIFYHEYYGWLSPQQFTASSTGRVIIVVEPEDLASFGGSYAIAYSTTNTRP